MSKHFITGIDIGTYHVKVVVVDITRLNDKRMPAVISSGISEARGMRHGYITNRAEIVKSLKEAVKEAEKNIDFKIKKAFFSVGGIGVQSIASTGSASVSRADMEVTALDIKKAHEEAENVIPQALMNNRKVLYTVPLQYKLDSKVVLGNNPEGMRGSKLDAKMLFVTCLEQHLSELLEATYEAGIEAIDIMPAPLAASFVTLSKTQKIAGCVLANIGAETVSIAVFENDLPISLEVFPIGSTDVTNDIALGLKIPLEEAEQIKVGLIVSSTYPRRKIEEIVNARLIDIFEIIENHLKKIGKNGLLPAGIIITGGGSGLSNIEDLAKAALRIPSRIGNISGVEIKDNIKDSTWAVAYGLCIFGMTSDGMSGIPPLRNPLSEFTKYLGGWFKKLLP